MFETKQHEIIDKLMDLPRITEEEVFDELVNFNKYAQFKFSPYVLANMWNETTAVKSGFASGKTANDFMS